MSEVMIPITMFAMIAAIVIVPAWFKSKERKEMQATLRASVEKGQPLPPEVIEALSRDNTRVPSTASRDLRIGVILLSVAIGIATAFSWLGYQIGHEEPYGFAAFAAIPGAIGLAFIVLSFFNKNKG